MDKVYLIECRNRKRAGKRWYLCCPPENICGDPKYGKRAVLKSLGGRPYEFEYRVVEYTRGEVVSDE